MSNSSTSPKSALAKLMLYPKPKPFKVMVLGQAAIGKTALVVRFITRRFIGDYDPNLEKIYTFQTVIDKETVNFEILDTAGELREGECGKLEANIRWAEAFILMYSVTDKCSFDECDRLKFLINYNKRRRRLAFSMKFREDRVPDVPVVLVGNKTDIAGDRMVSTAEGQRRCQEIGCVAFHEISVRESIDQCWEVFHDVRRFWRVSSKWKGRRGEPCAPYLPPPLPLARVASDAAAVDTAAGSTETGGLVSEMPTYRYNLDDLEECMPEGVQESGSTDSQAADCALVSTDSLQTQPRNPRSHTLPTLPALRRRMSIAMRGNNTHLY